LASHPERRANEARNRQECLEGTTNDDVDADLRHRSVIPYVYQDFPVDRPVLATMAPLDETVQECQRTVRDHLVRRA
jgi:hypothetical protein